LSSTPWASLRGEEEREVVRRGAVREDALGDGQARRARGRGELQRHVAGLGAAAALVDARDAAEDDPRGPRLWSGGVGGGGGARRRRHLRMTCGGGGAAVVASREDSRRKRVFVGDAVRANGGELGAAAAAAAAARVLLLPLLETAAAGDAIKRGTWPGR